MQVGSIRSPNPWLRVRGGRMADLAEVQTTATSHKRSLLRRFTHTNRASLGTMAVFVVMMVIFYIGNPAVFSDWRIYNAVLTTLPIALFLVVPLVMIVTVGEIDLSFPAVMGFSCWIFALIVQTGLDPLLAMAGGIAVGMLLGAGIGAVVVYG